METCAELSDVPHLEEKRGVGCEVEKERWKQKETAKAYSCSERDDSPDALSSTLFCCHQRELDNVISSPLIFLTLSRPLCHPSVAFFHHPISQVRGNKRCQSKTLVINLSWLKGEEGG